MDLFKPLVTWKSNSNEFGVVYESNKILYTENNGQVRRSVFNVRYLRLT